MEIEWDFTHTPKSNPKKTPLKEIPVVAEFPFLWGTDESPLSLWDVSFSLPRMRKDPWRDVTDLGTWDSPASQSFDSSRMENQPLGDKALWDSEHTHTTQASGVWDFLGVCFVPPPPCPNQTHAVVKGMAVTHRKAVGSHSGNISWEETLEQSYWLDKCIRKGKRKGFKVKKKFSPSVLLNSQSCDLIQGQQLSSKSWWSPRIWYQTMMLGYKPGKSKLK